MTTIVLIYVYEHHVQDIHGEDGEQAIIGDDVDDDDDDDDDVGGQSMFFLLAKHILRLDRSNSNSTCGR